MFMIKSFFKPYRFLIISYVEHCSSPKDPNQLFMNGIQTYIKLWTLMRPRVVQGPKSELFKRISNM